MSFLGKIGERFRNMKDSGIYNKYLKKVNSESDFSALSDKEISETFSQLKSQNNPSDKDNLPEVIALADEALARSSGIRFFETQKVSAVLLTEGNLLEMATGEGKTLAFALAAILLSSKHERVTICTANDFLAERDFKATKKLFNLLGITTAIVGGDTQKVERKSAYNNRIVYTTIRELAYDHLRDGRTNSFDEVLLPAKGFLLIDEADNALVDNAASPYHLSKEIEPNARLIVAAHDFAFQSKASSSEDEHYKIGEDGKAIEISEKGLEALEGFLVKHNFISNSDSLYSPENLYLIRLFENAGRAIHVMTNGVDYTVQDGAIRVIDKNSGRVLSAVSLNDGLQQLLETRHGLTLSKESVSTDSIVTESVVRMFDDFAGMSGTLKVDEEEIASVYGKTCMCIPRNKPLARIDKDDVMFILMNEKIRYTLELTSKAYQSGRPVMLVATTEDEARGLKRALDKLKIPSHLITSESLLDEASMIAMAGTPYRVTVTTASSGRGTDIILGGNLDHFIENKLIESDRINTAREEQSKAREQVISKGGLLVVGFGRQPIKKLDQQLRGRSGRQGDVGETIFVMSLEDKALGEYGGKLQKLLKRMNVSETDILSHPMISKAFDNSQRNIREAMLKSRKYHAQHASTLEEQRAIVFSMRMDILINSDWQDVLTSKYGFNLHEDMEMKEVLEIFDRHINDYNDAISDLKKSIGFQSYANKNPTQELKKKAFVLYEALMNAINDDFCDFPRKY